MRIRKLKSFFKKVCNFSILIARKYGKGRHKTPSQTMNIRKYLPAVAGFFIATAAFAARCNLPTPPPSEFIDAESSVNVPLDPSRGPLMRLRLAADFTPSNAVIVAFGTDADNDGDLSPEETVLQVGADCGASFIRDESKSKVEVEQWNSNLICSPSDFAFVLKQPKAVCWNLAKVTAHNLTSTNLVVTLSRVGTTILVR